MSDENKVAETVTAFEGLVKAIPIYQDLLQPSMQELGKSLQLVAKSIKVALAPLAALVWGYDRIQNFLEAALQEKLAGVSIGKIISPKPEVAGPAIEALRFTGHNDTLRDLYANLLATAMDADTAANAHPAFVDIIKNISPDEGRIIKLFSEKHSVPLIDVHRLHLEKLNAFETILVNYSHLETDASCEHSQLVPSYIDNLCRLRLVEIVDDAHIAEPNTYELLENDSQMEAIKATSPNVSQHIRFKRKILQRTVFGQQFINACIETK
jgi:Abortive infection alpha